MIKCKIHIGDGDVYMDKEVCIEIELPCLPHRGDSIWLDEAQKLELEQKAKSSVDVARRYAPTWFYHKSRGIEYHEVKSSNLKDLDFSDAKTIGDMMFKGNSKFVHIEIVYELSDINY